MGRAKLFYILLAVSPIALAMLIPLLIPKLSVYSTAPGTDKFEAHFPLSDNYSVTQTLTPEQNSLARLGIMLVPLKESRQGEVRLHIADSTETQLFYGSIPTADIKDDQFEYFNTNLTDIAGKNLTVKLATSEPRASANIAVRLDADIDLSAQSSASRDDDTLIGPIAHTLIRKTNIHGYIADQLKQSPKLMVDLTAGLIAAGIIALVYLYLANPKKIKIGRWHIEKVILASVLIAIAATSWHLAIVDEANGVSGGDTYNFLFIMQHIQDDFTFYTSAQKRLPFFPLVLLPTQLLTSDIILSARIVNQVVMGLTLVALAIVARQLKLPAQAVFLGVVLTAVNRDFIAVSFRPLAYPLTGLLLLVGLAALFWAKTNPRRLIIAGTFLGLAAQTRHEAIAASFVIVFVASLIWIFKKKWKTAATLVIPFLIIIAPYFIANTINLGNPFQTGYLDHPVTNPRRSLSELQDNVGRTWGVLGSSWWHHWAHEMRIPLDHREQYMLLTAAAIAVLVPQVRKKLPKTQAYIPPLAATLSVVMAIAIIISLLAQPETMRVLASISIIFVVFIGFAALCLHAWTKKSLNTLILLATAAVLLIVGAWIHPAAKQFYSFLPYAGLAAGLGLYAILHPLFKNALKPISWIGITLIISILSLPITAGARTLTEALDFENRKNVHDWLYYNMSRHLSDTSQTELVAITVAPLPAIYFLGREAAVQYPPEDNIVPNEETLRARGVRWIFWTSFENQFTYFAENPEDFPVKYSIISFNRDDDKVEGRIIEILKTLPGQSE